MEHFYIDLKKGLLVKSFVETVGKLSGTCNIIQGRTVLDATSILGIYSLDLSVPLLMRTENCTEEDAELLRGFVVS
jgi:hypothetical protein